MKKFLMMIVIALFLATTQIKAAETTSTSSNVVPTSVYPIPDEFSDSLPWSKIFNEMLGDESKVFILNVQGYGGSTMAANGFLQTCKI